MVAIITDCDWIIHRSRVASTIKIIIIGGFTAQNATDVPSVFPNATGRTELTSGFMCFAKVYILTYHALGNIPVQTHGICSLSLCRRLNMVSFVCYRTSRIC